MKIEKKAVCQMSSMSEYAVFMKQYVKNTQITYHTASAEKTSLFHEATGAEDLSDLKRFKKYSSKRMTDKNVIVDIRKNTLFFC